MYLIFGTKRSLKRCKCRPSNGVIQLVYVFVPLPRICAEVIATSFGFLVGSANFKDTRVYVIDLAQLSESDTLSGCCFPERPGDSRELWGYGATLASRKPAILPRQKNKELYFLNIPTTTRIIFGKGHGWIVTFPKY